MRPSYYSGENLQANTQHVMKRKVTCKKCTQNMFDIACHTTVIWSSLATPLVILIITHHPLLDPRAPSVYSVRSARSYVRCRRATKVALLKQTKPWLQQSTKPLFSNFSEETELASNQGNFQCHRIRVQSRFWNVTHTVRVTTSRLSLHIMVKKKTPTTNKPWFLFKEPKPHLLSWRNTLHFMQNMSRIEQNMKDKYGTHIL